MMGDIYIITGVQLGILMSCLSGKAKMELLQDVMDNQLLEDIVEINIKKRKFNLRGEE